MSKNGLVKREKTSLGTLHYAIGGYERGYNLEKMKNV